MVKKWSQEVTKEQALAEAWEIGFKAGADFGPNNRPRPDNPYRKDR
jgi:hypothetical protein